MKSKWSLDQKLYPAVLSSPLKDKIQKLINEVTAPLDIDACLEIRPPLSGEVGRIEMLCLKVDGFKFPETVPLYLPTAPFSTPVSESAHQLISKVDKYLQDIATQLSRHELEERISGTPET